MISTLITIACLGSSPPPGARCKECEATGDSYYVYSYDYDHGGCRDDQQCVEVPVAACNPGKCCSNVTIQCTGKHIAMYIRMIAVFVKHDVVTSISCNTYVIAHKDS